MLIFFLLLLRVRPNFLNPVTNNDFPNEFFVMHDISLNLIGQGRSHDELVCTYPYLTSTVLCLLFDLIYLQIELLVFINGDKVVLEYPVVLFLAFGGSSIINLVFPDKNL